MPTIITVDLLQKYFKEKKTHAAYKDSCEQYEKIKVHADGEMPGKLITTRRPSEAAYIQKYRESIYIPITECTITKIQNSLSKIRRSQDWSIKYNEADIPKKIDPKQTPEKYFGCEFPNFESITNWVFEMCLKNYLIDPNALFVVMPIELTQPKNNAFLKPYPFIFNSPDVIEYKQGDFCILKSKEKSSSIDDKGIVFNGEVWYVINNDSILKYEQNNKGEFELTIEYLHMLDSMPVFKMPGVFYKAVDSYVVNKSRISATIPYLDEAAREYSDLQAEIVQHTHSEKWVYETQECTMCNGNGKMSKGTGDKIVWDACPQCQGKGTVSTSPYNNIVVKRDPLSQQQVPIPPAGFITKTDVALMVEIMNKRIDGHLYKALSAVNMQFLDQTPMAQSGIAKEIDRDELNNFVHSIAEDLVRIMDKVIDICIEYRYQTIVPSAEEREKLCPQINVPEKYDLLSSSMLMDELGKAKTATINPLLIKALELEFASKKFTTNPEVLHILSCIYEMDPFGGVSNDDKMVIASNNWAEEEDIIISANINQFIKKAMEEDKDFAQKTYKEKREILELFAKEIMDAKSVAKDILDSGIDGPGASKPDPNTNA